MASKNLNKEIVEELKEIKKEEAEILEKEKSSEKILKSSSFKEVLEAAPALHEVNTFRSKVVRRLQKHRLLFTLFVALGIVLVWRGLWEITEHFITSAVVSLILGIVLLWLIKRYTDLH